MHSALFRLFTLILHIAFTTTALPAQKKSNEMTAAQVLQIVPKSKHCSSSMNECATNIQATPFLNAAMSKYDITNPMEKASVLALIAFESGDFKYNINHFPAPGHPGQGTRNMQSASYNLEYAKSIPELASKTSYTSTEGLSPDQLNEIRALVLPDEYSWASAAWYLTQQSSCSDARQALQAGSDEGFAAHMRCVGISNIGNDRISYWQAAKKALIP
ncbi:hypothetical protein GcM1_209041 [Golovinomyces cichoracearum]|uniref:Transglycosylase SLT domain-containing protein n=1 Tax=Golovinomyces cichoracearum TaxID=62708 RepID=A0A420IVZ2_9PEZI|nr:hypothetical protein GcM1_209041 [Golovinomyces cichoracearum]